MPRTRCALCDSEIALRSNIYPMHDTPQGSRCDASDATRTEAVRMRRVFRSTSGHGAQLQVWDNTDSIGIRTLLAGNGFELDIWTDLDGREVRRLIAELTTIANERGLS